jgi:hypothetical protein
MKLSDLRTALEQYPETFPRFVLPDGEQIPAHAHITEVGHVAKNFVDCGGVIGKSETVLLQTHVGRDTEHRLKSARLAQILELGRRVLPHDQFEVEVEYDCCVVAQYPVEAVTRDGQRLDIYLGKRRTQCLAQVRREQKSSDACGATSAACCC